MELPGELFSEPAWVFLLELFIADARGVKLTGRQVSKRGGIDARVASAWLRHLSGLGLVIGDGKGDLDDLLTLSSQGLERMERLMKRSRLTEEARLRDFAPR